MAGDQDLILTTLLKLERDIGTLTEAVRNGCPDPQNCPALKAVQVDVVALTTAIKDQATLVTGLRLTRAKAYGALLGIGLVAGASGGGLERLLFP